MRRVLLISGCTIALIAADSSSAAAQGQPVENNVLNYGQCIAGGSVAPSDASGTSPLVVLFGPPFADPDYGFSLSPIGRQDLQATGCSTLFFTP